MIRNILRHIGALATLCVVTPLWTPARSQQPTAPVPTPAAYNGGYLVFKSADGAFAYWLDGRVQVDAAFYRGSKNALGSGTRWSVAPC